MPDNKTTEQEAPAAPQFPTVTLTFENLGGVALIVPDPTGLIELQRIAAEVGRQIAVMGILRAEAAGREAGAQAAESKLTLANHD